MKHARSLKQRIASALYIRAHKPPHSQFQIGDQVSWSGVDGIVVSVTPTQLQAIFPKTGEGVAPIIVKFDTRGMFFPLAGAGALLFIHRPKITQEATPSVQITSETATTSSDVL